MGYSIRKSFWGPLAVAGLVYTAMAWALPIFWSTNDDMLMAGLASGRMFGKPTEFLLFTHPLAGLLWKGLYTALPQVPWYALTFLLLQAVASAVLWQVARPLTGVKAAALMALYGLALYLFIDQQFTTTAGYAALAGLLAALLAYHRRKWGALWAALALFAAGALLRVDSAVYVWLVVAAGILGWQATLARRRWGWLLPLAGVGAFCIGLMASSKAYYSHSPGWEGYLAFSANRAAIQDASMVPPAARTQMVKQGWSQTDFELYKYFLPDPGAPWFGPAPVAEMARAMSGHRLAGLNTVGVMHAFALIGQYYRYYTLLALLPLALALVAVRGRRKWLFALPAVAAFGLLLVMAQLMGIKDRVLILCLLSLAGSVLLLAALAGSGGPLKRGSPVPLLQLLVAVVALYTAKISIANTLSKADEVARENNSWRQINLAAYPMLVSYDQFPHLINDPLHRAPPVAGLPPVVPTNYLYNTPLLAAYLEQLGLNPNQSFYVQAARRGAAFSLRSFQVPVMERYLNEHDPAPTPYRARPLATLYKYRESLVLVAFERTGN